MTEIFAAITGSRIIQLALCSGLGLLVNLSLGLSGQAWSSLKSQRYSAIVLPPAGAIITWTISSNLALSLGMIGALSIVRFRTPIKNPFELVIFFSYLILGISAGVNPRFSVALAALLIVTPAFVAVLDQIFAILGSTVSRRLRSRTEFASAPVQLVAQFRQKRIEIPPNIPVEEIVSISSQPEPDSEYLLVDLTISFPSKREALACLDSLQSEQLIFSSVRSSEA
jgi:hypothetical protein